MRHSQFLELLRVIITLVQLSLYMNNISTQTITSRLSSLHTGKNCAAVITINRKGILRGRVGRHQAFRLLSGAEVSCSLNIPSISSE